MAHKGNVASGPGGASSTIVGSTVLGTVGAGGPIQPFKFWTPSPQNQTPFGLYDNWDDIGIFSQYSTPDFYYQNYYAIGMQSLAEYSYGDNVESTPPLFLATDSILMGYRGYATSRSNMLIADEGIEKVQPESAWDTDADDQFNATTMFSPNIYYGAPYNIDGDISDTGVELLPPGTIMGWDNDTENQVQQLPSFQCDFEDDWEWSTLGITTAASDIILMGYFVYSVIPGARDQRQEDWIQFTQIVPITDYTWDNDAENQSQQASWSLDILEERPEIFLLAYTWDIDLDPRQWPDYYRDDISGDRVNTNQQEHVPANATDYMYQFQQPSSFNLDFEDDWEWNPSGLSVAASDIILMSYYGYSVLPGSREDPTLWVPIVLFDYTWDIDLDSRQWADWNK